MRTVKTIFFASFFGLLASAAHAAVPGDSASGRRLYEANCTRCHDSSVYTRPDRHVRSLDALQQQVAGCGHMTNQTFSAAQTRDLVKYLNDRFYHFP
ncbi:MAG: cytochrome c, partial [Betaproteobacteria bacterium]|jgi:mono/diheme cytochrome c family protein